MPSRPHSIAIRAAAAALTALALLAAPSVASAWTAGVPLTNPFPRLSMWWPDTAASSPADLARYDWIVLGAWDTPAVVAPIKAVNPYEIVLSAANACEIQYDPDAAAGSASNAALRAISTRWLLTQAGSTLSAPAGITDTTLHVSAVTSEDGAGHAVSLFEAGDPIVLGDELAIVTSVNASSHTLTVRRGVVKAATAHDAGTRVAATISSWPNALMCDLTSNCPLVTVDGSVGPETWAEYNARVGTARIADPIWDGLVVDRTGGDYAWLLSSSTARSVDLARSNAVNTDAADFNDAWGAGLRDYEVRLRLAVGPDRLMLLNWGTPNYDLLNGNNFETFPNSSTAVDLWKRVAIGPWPKVGSYLEWLANARQPNLTSILTYDDEDGPEPTSVGTWQNPAVLAGYKPNYAKMRYGLATTLLGDGFFSYEVASRGHGALGLLWFDEYKGAGRGAGWLGWPSAPATQVVASLTTPDRLSGQGTFDTSSLFGKWSKSLGTGASATLVRDPSGLNGTSCARLDVSATDGVFWHAALSHTVAITKGAVHSLIFWASADATHNVNAFVQLPNSPWTDIADFGDAVIVPGWHRYVMTATGGQTYSAGQLKICAGDTVGTVRFDNITLQQGTVDVWRRPYSGGMAVVNGGTSTLVVPLGGVYRRLLGTQARSANNGRVATVVTLAPHSGLVLATCDTLKVTDALAAARTADLGAASDARAARSHYLTLSHHGSRAARAKAVKAAAAWKTAANAASAAATAADKALTRLLIDSPGGGIYLERAQTAADLARRRSNTAYSLGRGSSAPRARSRARTADTLIDGVAVSAR